MLLRVVVLLLLLLLLINQQTVTSGLILTDKNLEDSSFALSEIVEELHVPSIAVLLVQRRFKALYGEFLGQLNRKLHQSITFDDREKFLLWVEESQKLGFSTTTLIFGKPKDLVEEVKIITVFNGIKLWLK